MVCARMQQRACVPARPAACPPACPPACHPRSSVARRAASPHTHCGACAYASPPRHRSRLTDLLCVAILPSCLLLRRHVVRARSCFAALRCAARRMFLSSPSPFPSPFPSRPSPFRSVCAVVHRGPIALDRPAPDRNCTRQVAPFKLTDEYIELMGGVRSPSFRLFHRLFTLGLIALQVGRYSPRCEPVLGVNLS